MTSDTAAFDLPEPPPPPVPSHHAAARHGWFGNDLALGSALIVLLIALFLPWFSATVPAGPVNLGVTRSEEHTSELQSRENLVCRLLLEKKKKNKSTLSILKKKKKTQKRE